MTGGRRTRAGLLPLSLLFLLTLGVLGMHTLGHAGMSPSMDTGMTAISGADKSNHHLPMTDPAEVCVAILAAVALIVSLLALTNTTGPADSAGRRAAGTAVRSVRAPPPVKRVGLLLTDLAVLRN